tara:strand:- start:219 stop:1217 length:999 start_codon:yes stop_codon:yes gene_type:complete
MAVYTTIDNSQEYFAVTTYTGNAAEAGDGSTQAITNVGHQPNMLWFKKRSATGNHHVVDSVRGRTKELRFNLTNAEADDDNLLVSFDSNGFTLGSSGSANLNSATYVAWTWKESATSGFDIVSYTGNGADRNIAHSLSAVPEWMIVKKRSGTDAGAVYLAANGNTVALLISETNANDDELYWNDTTPTSSVFTLGGNISNANTNGQTYINYLWAPKQGFSRFGKYFGNANADGTFVYTGFKPAWVMIKRSSTAGDNWLIHDIKRDGYNGANKQLDADQNQAEGNSRLIDMFSNGFKIIINDAKINASGDTYQYMAFAESPFVNSKGVPNNAR